MKKSKANGLMLLWGAALAFLHFSVPVTSGPLGLSDLEQEGSGIISKIGDDEDLVETLEEQVEVPDLTEAVQDAIPQNYRNLPYEAEVSKLQDFAPILNAKDAGSLQSAAVQESVKQVVKKPVKQVAKRRYGKKVVKEKSVKQVVEQAPVKAVVENGRLKEVVEQAPVEEATLKDVAVKGLVSDSVEPNFQKLIEQLEASEASFTDPSSLPVINPGDLIPGLPNPALTPPATESLQGASEFPFSSKNLDGHPFQMIMSEWKTEDGSEPNQFPSSFMDRYRKTSSPFGFFSKVSPRSIAPSEQIPTEAESPSPTYDCEFEALASVEGEYLDATPVVPLTLDILKKVKDAKKKLMKTYRNLKAADFTGSNDLQVCERVKINGELSLASESLASNLGHLANLDIKTGHKECRMKAYQALRTFQERMKKIHQGLTAVEATHTEKYLEKIMKLTAKALAAITAKAPNNSDSSSEVDKS